MTATGSGIDTREMLVVHSAFRREFREAPALIRGVAPGDRARVDTVAAHLQLMLEVLHHHHDGEDRLVWPRLQQRVPAELAPIVELMESQHAELDRATEALAAWRSSAAEADRDALADAVERVTDPLLEHLDAEEERLLPIASQHLSQEEWNELGEDGMRSVAGRQRALVFGMFMADGDPEVIRQMIATAPPPVRLLLPRLAPRVYRRYRRRLHIA